MPSISVTGGVRRTLSADQIFYVRTDGNDSNDGFTDSSTGAWKTWQHAVDWVAVNLDFAGYQVTIQHGNEGAGVKTFTVGGGASFINFGDRDFVGSGVLVIQGNATDIVTPSNLVFQNTSNGTATIECDNSVTEIHLNGFACRPSGNATCLAGWGSAVYVFYQNIDFGATTGIQVAIQASGAQFYMTGNCTISGGAGAHIQAWGGGSCWASYNSPTITLTGTPNFSLGFAYAVLGGSIDVLDTITFAGTATGPKFQVISNGAIASGQPANGVNFFPGSIAGAFNSGGVYDNVVGGVADGSNPAVGQIGEEISSVVAATTQTLATGVAQDATTIALTAGDWDVTGEVWFVGSAAVTVCSGGISTTAASIPASPAVGQSRATSNASQAAGTTVLSLAVCRVNVAAPTTMHLGVSATFASGTVTAGGKIRARRRR